MRSLASAAVLVLLGTGVSAHHSHPDFLLDHDATLEGVIESVEFQNPHMVITLRTSDSTLYRAEWQGARWLNYNQVLVTPIHGPVQSDTLKVGDFIVIVGCPPRDPARHELVNLKAVRRPHDGWLWTCRRPDLRQWC